MEKINAGARRLISAALLERWPQICRINHVTKLLTNRFVPTTTNSMKCVVNWIPLSTAFVLEIPNPTLKCRQ